MLNVKFLYFELTPNCHGLSRKTCFNKTMLTPQDLQQIKTLMIEVIDTRVPPMIERILEEKLEEKLEKKLEQKLKPIRRRLLRLEKEVKFLRETLNYTIQHFEERHNATNKRFERIERFLGIYNPADPLILRDAPLQNKYVTQKTQDS
jgi:hypothetical protein